MIEPTADRIEILKGKLAAEGQSPALSLRGVQAETDTARPRPPTQSICSESDWLQDGQPRFDPVASGGEYRLQRSDLAQCHSEYLLAIETMRSCSQSPTSCALPWTSIGATSSVGSKPAWDQLIRVATRWTNVADQQPARGPWWLSLRKGPPQLMKFGPGVPER